jgi:hypothetical protein
MRYLGGTRSKEFRVLKIEGWSENFPQFVRDDQRGFPPAGAPPGLEI